MHGQASPFRPRGLSQRSAWVFAASALALTLALGGCRSAAHSGGAQTTQQSQSGATTASGSATGGSGSSGASSVSSSAALQQLEGIDNQNQSDSQQLNAAQSAAGANYTSQQSQTQP